MFPAVKRLFEVRNIPLVYVLYCASLPISFFFGFQKKKERIKSDGDRETRELSLLKLPPDHAQSEFVQHLQGFRVGF
jgi:hypothetical protein